MSINSQRRLYIGRRNSKMNRIPGNQISQQAIDSMIKSLGLEKQPKKATEPMERSSAAPGAGTTSPADPKNLRGMHLVRAEEGTPFVDRVLDAAFEKSDLVDLFGNQEPTEDELKEIVKAEQALKKTPVSQELGLKDQKTKQALFEKIQAANHYSEQSLTE